MTAAFGTLINIDGTLRMNPYEKFYHINRKVYLFDSEKKRWRKMYLDDVPWTYTLAPFPRNFRAESKLWMFASRRVKHQFIWYNEQIPKTDFAKLKSKTNAKNHGRYSFLHF